MMLAAKFPGSSTGRKRLWIGHVWTAARGPVVVVIVVSATSSAGSGVTVLLAVWAVEDSRREVSCAVRGKLKLLVVCCADAAERRERRKWRVRVMRSIIMMLSSCLLSKTPRWPRGGDSDGSVFVKRALCWHVLSTPHKMSR